MNMDAKELSELLQSYRGLHAALELELNGTPDADLPAGEIRALAAWVKRCCELVALDELIPLVEQRLEAARKSEAKKARLDFRRAMLELIAWLMRRREKEDHER